MKLRSVVAVIVTALATAGTVEGGWKAGVSKVVITPQEPIWLAGYAARTKPSEGVLHDIHAKALALEDDGGTLSVLVTTDLLGFTRAMSAEVAARAEKRFGLPRARLALTSTHTHSAPVTGQLLSPAYELNEEQRAAISRYTAAVLDRVVEAIGGAIEDLGPAELTFEQGLAGFAVNRRRVGARNRPGPVEHDVPVLAVRAPGGKLRAIVFGYACHNTVLMDSNVSGDYAGFAQIALERENPGALALFVAGCGADANPLPRRTVKLATMYGETLAAAVMEVLAGKMKPVGGRVRAAFETVELPFEKPPSREELTRRLDDSDALRRRHAKLLLGVIEKDGALPAAYPYPVQVWQLGRDLTWIFLAGEVVVDYSLRLKAKHGWDDLWVAAYSNDVFAYIPSLRVLKEGGYEGGGAMIAYGQPGPFTAAVEELVADKVNELVARTRP
jgi:hypothetical protein